MQGLRPAIRIGDRLVGDGHACFVIAEAGVNHNGDINLGLQLIDRAADAGADAVKFQTFSAARLASPRAGQASYQTQNLGKRQSQLEMLRGLELDADDHRRLIDHCHKRGILFTSTPFDEVSADLLVDLGVEVLKLPSGEMTNTPFLRYVAGTGIPLIASTGMCTLGEVETAVETLSAAGQDSFVLLHCVSNYPAEPSEVNLRAMATMRAAFGRSIGYSDHTLGIEVGIAAAALGACVLEKHFTLDRSMPGPDHRASIEPDQLRQLISAVRSVEAAMGNGRKHPTASENLTAAAARKSLVTATDVPAGTMLTDELIEIKRPGTGLPPSMKPHLLRRRTSAALPAGHVLRLEDVA